jgi:S1-C subfamily serine protease
MKIKTTLLAALLLAGIVTSVRADELAEKGRAIFTKSRYAVVTVEIVLKVTYTSSGQNSTPQEAKQEATGTVIDPSGLTVVALSACDPSDLYQRMASEQSRYKIETEVGDVKLLLEDGTEIPAEIVLRDKDLDLAFLRPKTKPASPMTAVDMSKAAPAQVLDEVITLNRLGRAVSRAYSASVERISAVVQKPRTFYIPDSTQSTTTLGSPAFLPNGDVLGIFVMRAVSPTGGRANLAAIILPADDVMKGAKQAPEARGDTEKKDEPKAAAKDSKDAAEKK